MKSTKRELYISGITDILNPMTLDNLQSVISALAEPTRLRVLYLLFAHQDRDWDVSAIVHVLDLPQSTVSRHLARLRNESLVETARRGKHRIYRLADQQSRLEQALLAALESFVATTPEVQQDQRRAAEFLADRSDLEENDTSSLTPPSQYATKWLLERRGETVKERSGRDAVFRALSNRTRRELLDRIQSEPGATLAQAGTDVPGSRQAVRKHVEMLIEANLIHVVEDGRVRRLYYNAVPLQELYDRWTDEHSSVFAMRVLAVRDAVEAMENGDD